MMMNSYLMIQKSLRKFLAKQLSTYFNNHKKIKINKKLNIKNKHKFNQKYFKKLVM